MAGRKKKVVWVTKVSVGLRISLSKDAAQRLDVEAGDYVAIVEDDREPGKYWIKKAE